MWRRCRPSCHTTQDEMIDGRTRCSLIIFESTQSATSSRSGYDQADIVSSDTDIKQTTKKDKEEIKLVKVSVKRPTDP